MSWGAVSNSRQSQKSAQKATQLAQIHYALFLIKVTKWVQKKKSSNLAIKSLSWQHIWQSYDNYQPGRMNANMCFLWVTRSQPASHIFFCSKRRVVHSQKSTHLISPHLALSRSVAHKAITHFRHLTLSLVPTLVCSHNLQPSSPLPFSAVLGHVVFGWPTLHLPSWVHGRVMLQWCFFFIFNTSYPSPAPSLNHSAYSLTSA